MLVTGFSSRPERAVNQSTDGTAITMTGYVAPANTIDVSNANTPGVYDPTNPAGGSYFLSVLQVAPNGAIQATQTNAYSGNNGPASILVNGLYCTVGDSNNGSGTPANEAASAGVSGCDSGAACNDASDAGRELRHATATNPATGKSLRGGQAGQG
jgi:hypothetical protein